MRAYQFIVENSDRTDYVIYVNDKPATVYDTKAEAQRDLDEVKKKHKTAKIEIKRRVRSEKIDEDAGSSPGGVSPNTKMVCEKNPTREHTPRVRHYEDNYGHDRWEVLDWRGHRVHDFGSKDLAHEYLSKNRYSLEHPDGPLEESDKFVQFIPPLAKWLITYIPAGKRDPEYSYYNDEKKALLAVDKLRHDGHKIVGIPVQVSNKNVQEGGKSRPLTIDDLKVHNLVVRPSEVQQRNPMFAATEKKWNDIGFRWTDNLRCYWMHKQQLLDPRKRKQVERFLGRSLTADELPTMYIHKSQIPVSRRLGTYKE